MIFVFWLFFALIVYTYLGYPILLFFYGTGKRRRKDFFEKDADLPYVSIVIPVYNEEKIIGTKIENTLGLQYPAEKVEVVIISDASNDKTGQIVKQYSDRIRFLSLFSRQGKASALNAGVNAANSEIIVFSDASIMLDPKALKNIVAPFGDKNIGCVSGEDHISESSGGEGLYGRYELFLRNLESRANSVVGASGCFYAQRKDLCSSFAEGMAPDFLSVLNTVENGFLAVTCPSAVGYMDTVPEASQEYARKVRTFVRGITTLFYHKKLLNPFKYGFFSVELISHKLMRWFSGFFLIALLLSNAFLLGRPFYAFFFVLQAAFYIMAIIGWRNNRLLDNMKFLKIPFYFCLVNAASLAAWAKYLTGTRQEIWEPSKR